LLASLHLDLDDAWGSDALALPIFDAAKWGPALRFSAPSKLVEEFYREHVARLAPFILYGSGDFHHLTALWLRQLSQPFILVSFDNHPDWDLRPPRWCCGGWVNRALELPQVQKVSVWGCGNFECWWPTQIFGNRRAERAGKLEVHAWADDRPQKDQKRRGAIFRPSWREQFEQFVTGLAGGNVYVTVDLDCLEASAAITNWESGKFTTDDVAWALGRLRSETRIVGGDICGAFSQPKYARAKQRFLATIDHPKLPLPNEHDARKINRAALEKLWPILTQ
jgi:arginase family enzyme